MDNLPRNRQFVNRTGWVGPSAEVVHYPIRQGRELNFIALIERDDWQVESWKVQGTTDELLHGLKNWHSDVHTLASQIARPFKWALKVRPSLESWIKGRAALLGDACHSILPFLGQGSNMAIEDAYVLASLLSRHAPDVEAALSAYESERKPRAEAVVQKSVQHRAELFRPEVANLTTTEAIEWQKRRSREQYQWIYSYDATAIPA
jgi:salicylate hydroxylase